MREILDTALLDEATRAGAQAWQPWRWDRKRSASAGFSSPSRKGSRRSSAWSQVIGSIVMVHALFQSFPQLAPPPVEVDADGGLGDAERLPDLPVRQPLDLA